MRLISVTSSCARVSCRRRRRHASCMIPNSEKAGFVRHLNFWGTFAHKLRNDNLSMHTIYDVQSHTIPRRQAGRVVAYWHKFGVVLSSGASGQGAGDARCGVVFGLSAAQRSAERPVVVAVVIAFDPFSRARSHKHSHTVAHAHRF